MGEDGGVGGGGRVRHRHGPAVPALQRRGVDQHWPVACSLQIQQERNLQQRMGVSRAKHSPKESHR